MRKTARPLEDDGIAVIPVAIGDDADSKELEILAPDVLQPPDGIKPDELAKLIMKEIYTCLLYTSPSPRDLSTSRMPSSA